MLNFEKIRFKNILSFGNTWTTINIKDKKSILIQGSNGSGKSAGILDTLCFVLYGKPFRKISKPKLVNYRNRRECLVEVWFKDDVGYEYFVRRGINPQVFEIYKSGELIDQSSAIRDYQTFFETQILKMDFNAFTQIVILGKATYVAFLRLTTQERRKFIEQSLGLTIFGRMNEINKVRSATIKNALQEVKNDLVLLKQRIELTQKHINDFQKEANRIQQEQQQAIDTEIAELRQKNDTLTDERVELEWGLDANINNELESLNNKLEVCYEFQAKISSKLSSIRKRMEFFKNKDICPTCDSLLDSKIREEKQNQFIEKEQELLEASTKLNNKIEKLVRSAKLIRSKMEDNQKIQSAIHVIDQRISDNLSRVNILERKRNETQVSNDDRIRQQELELKTFIDAREQKIEERTSLIELQDCHDFIAAMLKDTGIKSTIIKNRIPKIESIMNEYLRHFGLFAKFELDENFNETLYARGMERLTYQAFSEGEKLRIDLAMLMTWREICKIQNNMVVNFLVFDEILDASLDESGAESLVSLFQCLARAGTKIIVISHSAEKWEEKFESRLIFTKQAGFSKIEEY